MRGGGNYRGRDLERFVDEDEFAHGSNSNTCGRGESRERDGLPDSPHNTKRTRRVLRSLDFRSIDQDVPVRLSSSRLAARLSDRFLDPRSRFLDLSWVGKKSNWKEQKRRKENRRNVLLCSSLSFYFLSNINGAISHSLLHFTVPSWLLTLLGRSLELRKNVRKNGV